MPKFSNDLYLGFIIYLPKRLYHLSPNISDDIFFLSLVIDLSDVLMCRIFCRGGQIRSRHRYGGSQNPYLSTYSQFYHCSLCPRGGPNSIANFDGGQWPDLPPWIRHCWRKMFAWAPGWGQEANFAAGFCTRFNRF